MSWCLCDGIVWIYILSDGRSDEIPSSIATGNFGAHYMYITPPGVEVLRMHQTPGVINSSSCLMGFSWHIQSFQVSLKQFDSAFLTAWIHDDTVIPVLYTVSHPRALAQNTPFRASAPAPWSFHPALPISTHHQHVCCSVSHHFIPSSVRSRDNYKGALTCDGPPSHCNNNPVGGSSKWPCLLPGWGSLHLQKGHLGLKKLD